MVVALQNHDQIGNRAFGERLNHQIDAASFRAASALLLFVPETPLLFMGQEWAASSPFCYFTDHHPELGRLVTEGRRAEFSKFAAFADADTRARIPDPQALSTFAASRLDWSEASTAPHAACLRLYRALLDLRRDLPAGGIDAFALDADTLGVMRKGRAGEAMLLVVRLRGSGNVTWRSWDAADRMGGWRVVLTTEDRSFVEPPHPIAVDLDNAAPEMSFPRPGAVFLRTI
jgi:maltooligosyltrehalose trehalohydrolase